MRKYFYNDGTNEHGPFTLGELREKEITKSTKVWFAELKDWAPAGDVPELSALFVSTSTPTPPPLVVNPPTNEGNAQPPKSWLTESILVTVFCCLIFGIVGIVKAASVESRFYAGDMEGAKKLSKEAEKWTVWGFWVGLIFGVLYIGLIVALSFAGKLPATF